MMSALSERSSLGNSQRANTPYGQKTPRQRPMPRNASPDDTRASARKASLNALLGGNPTTPRAAPFSATIGPGSTRPTMPEGQIDIDVGDTVEVPGGMTGTVKFLGNVRGKKGIFAGIELSTEYADRGKNDGDVEGYVHVIALYARISDRYLRLLGSLLTPRFYIAHGILRPPYQALASSSLLSVRPN